MKNIVKFRQAAKPQAYPKRYVEDFAAKHDFIRTSSLKGCGAAGRMLRLSAGGETALGIAPDGKACERSSIVRNGSVYEF